MKQLILQSLSRIDMVIWAFVILFFCGSSLLFDGDFNLSFIGAAGIIVEMLIISVSIEIIIEALKSRKGIGTITGFITNGPEALCLIVGLAVGDILFAASTPLGSNFMNPLLLLTAAGLTGALGRVFGCRPRYTVLTMCVTIFFAVSFYLIDERSYPWWAVGGLTASVMMFLRRPEEVQEERQEKAHPSAVAWLIPAILILIGTGYLLDPVVGFAAEHSKAPKGVIGFFVLAALSSWPEFKTCIALLNRGKTLEAILNITVSNITNIWLAVAGVAVYLFMSPP